MLLVTGGTITLQRSGKSTKTAAAVSILLRHPLKYSLSCTSCHLHVRHDRTTQLHCVISAAEYMKLHVHLFCCCRMTYSAYSQGRRQGIYFQIQKVCIVSPDICRATVNKKAVLSQGNRAMPQLVLGLKFADNIHYKFKSSQASKARLQRSKRTGAKHNLTQNGHSRSRVLESVERR